MDWEELVEHLLQHLHREVLAEGETGQSHQLFNELMSYPNVPEPCQILTRATQNTLLLTTHFRRDAKRKHEPFRGKLAA